MPRSLEPNSRIVFVLECDRDKSPQPKAFGRTLSISQTRKLISAMTSLQHATTLDQKLDTAIDAAMAVLTGWEHMTDPTTGDAIPFSRDALADVYSIDELTEILSIAAGDGRLNADERKKSESQHSSVVESCARVAQGAVPELSVPASQPKSSVPSAVGQAADSATADGYESSNARSYT